MIEIIPAASFRKALKPLAKKYRSLMNDLNQLADQIRNNPKIGTPIGHDCFKIRLAISSKNQGKSGGARVITCVKIVNEQVVLLTIYDKSERDNITDKELLALLKELE
ncbi:MAG: type II toxin-antitoxin system RelE/ParE family toxin [Spirosomaceae bacterium]|jgi:hypothetical protein|nr:type II toxin-antitoxin system RelE/ParE family toxin [Spirosomataceae bacterium]